MSEASLLQAAQLLADAWKSRGTIDFPAELLPNNRQAAYLIQDKMAELIAGDPANAIVGWKVGATSPGVQKAEGYDGPIPGRIFASTLYDSPTRVPAASCPQAKLEAEVAFRFIADLNQSQYPISADDLADMAVLHPAFDITSTRYNYSTRAAWDKTQNMLAGIADNGNGGAVVIGPAVRSWQEVTLMELDVGLHINDKGSVRNLFGEFRGDPIEAFVWTVTSVIERGFGFRAGDYVLTGSLTEPQDLSPGDKAVAHFPIISEMSIIFL